MEYSSDPARQSVLARFLREGYEVVGKVAVASWKVRLITRDATGKVFGGNVIQAWGWPQTTPSIALKEQPERECGLVGEYAAGNRDKMQDGAFGSHGFLFSVSEARAGATQKG